MFGYEVFCSVEEHDCTAAVMLDIDSLAMIVNLLVRPTHSNILNCLEHIDFISELTN